MTHQPHKKSQTARPDVRLECLRIAAQTQPNSDTPDILKRADEFVEYVTGTDVMAVGDTMKVRIAVEDAGDRASLAPLPLPGSASKLMQAILQGCDPYNGKISLSALDNMQAIPKGSISQAIKILKQRGFVETEYTGPRVLIIRAILHLDGTPFTGGATVDENGITQCPPARARGSYYSQELGANL